MKRALISITLLVSTSGFASLIPDLAGPKLRELMGDRVTTDCADFSGSWKGYCTGSTDAVSVYVAQHGCEVIKFNEVPNLIGAAGSHAVGIPGDAANFPRGAFLSSSTSLNWNAERNALVSEISVNLQRLGQASGAYQIQATGMIRMVGKQLMSEFRLADKAYACVLDRQ